MGGLFSQQTLAPTPVAASTKATPGVMNTPAATEPTGSRFQRRTSFSGTPQAPPKLPEPEPAAASLEPVRFWGAGEGVGGLG